MIILIYDSGNTFNRLALLDGDNKKAGVITGVVYEINEYIRTFKKEIKKLIDVITGGNSDFFRERIRYNTRHIPELVMDELNNILEYNAK